MPFCGNCGGSVSGAFCPKCGTPIQSAAPSAAPPPAPVSSAPGPQPAAVPRKSTSPVVWIVGILLGLFLIGFLAVVGAGLFVVHKVKQAGLDPDLMRRNPGIAVTKMLAATNPDISVVSVDEDKGLVTLSDKKTGKTVTVNFEDVKQGKIKFQADGKEAVTVEAHGEGQSGALEVKGPDGAMKFGGGANAKIPDWIPSYPSSTPQGAFSMQGGQEDGGTYQFTTKDSPKDVMSFYDQKLQDAGLKITSRTTHDEGTTSGGLLSAEDAAKKRTVVVTVGTADGGTHVNVLYQVKK